MSTTSLFVELLIIGAGATVWVALFLFAVVGFPTEASALQNLVKDSESLLFMAAPAFIAFTYLLGIIVDRWADTLFGNFARRQDTDGGFFMFKTKEEAREARTFLYERSSALRDLFEYGRSRLRVCRGWGLNAALTGPAALLVIWIQLPPDAPRILFTVVTVVGCGLLAMGCYRAWKNLLRGESARLFAQYNQLHAELKAE